MKNIRTILLSALIGVSTLVGTTQSVSAQKIFTEIPHEPSVSVVDPELKKVLPILFTPSEEEKKIDQGSDAEMFTAIAVNKTISTAIKKNAGTHKVMPLAADEVIGVSTFYSRFHPGIDMRAKVGTPVRAMLPGTVNEVEFERGGYGRYVVLVHHVGEKTIFSLYAHMKDSKVNVGDVVDADTIIGTVGMTGRTSGPHLHFEIHEQDRAIDPIKFFASNSIAMARK